MGRSGGPIEEAVQSQSPSNYPFGVGVSKADLADYYFSFEIINPQRLCQFASSRVLQGWTIKGGCAPAHLLLQTSNIPAPRAVPSSLGARA